MRVSRSIANSKNSKLPCKKGEFHILYEEMKFKIRKAHKTSQSPISADKTGG